MSKRDSSSKHISSSLHVDGSERKSPTKREPERNSKAVNIIDVGVKAALKASEKTKSPFVLPSIAPSIAPLRDASKAQSKTPSRSPTKAPSKVPASSNPKTATQAPIGYATVIQMFEAGRQAGLKEIQEKRSSGYRSEAPRTERQPSTQIKKTQARENLPSSGVSKAPATSTSCSTALPSNCTKIELPDNFRGKVSISNFEPIWGALFEEIAMTIAVLAGVRPFLPLLEDCLMEGLARGAANFDIFTGEWFLAEPAVRILEQTFRFHIREKLEKMNSGN